MNLATEQAKAHRFHEDYYGFLKGATCTGVKVRPDEDGAPFDFWTTLTFAKVLDAPMTVDDRSYKAGDTLTFEVEISRDEEGNGPGFLFGLPMKETR